jgi:hypothetical protein
MDTNQNEVQISLSITPIWSILNEVKDKIADFMFKKKFQLDIVEASMMCASELVENAIKYGAAETEHVNIKFELITRGKTVRIMVSNGIRDIKYLEELQHHIDKLKSGDDPFKIYTERLKELMVNPKPGESKLGLYRIAYEGEFDLDHTFRNETLTVIAERITA